MSYLLDSLTLYVIPINFRKGNANGEPFVSDPRDTNLDSDCSDYVAPIATDEEIAELADAYDTELLAKPQLNTQSWVMLKTLHDKQIPGVWPMETLLQRGFRIADKQNAFNGETLLCRVWSAEDADWLIAYAAQGGGV